jgi:GT2 family glycosyltransferase
LPTPVQAEPARSATIALQFDEQAYLATYSDALISIDTGEFATAREHYEQFGRRESRLSEERYIRALGLGPADIAIGDGPGFNIDTIVCCRSGTALIVGWTDDRDSPLHSLSILTGGDQSFHTTAFGRVRRGDVEASLQATPGHLFGFWVVASLGADLSADPWILRARRSNGRFGQREVRARMVSEVALRTTILEFFAGTEYFGNRVIESFHALDAGIGAAVVALNRRITQSIVANAWVTYYGPARDRFLGSVIVCIYGKPEFMFLQLALFSAAPRASEYEFVFVSNSPELTEALEKEARICARIYGLSIVLVCLPDNAGFGGANNVAARYARSPRLLITNPDVFPRDDGWAERHAAIVAGSPRDQTLLFGAPLYYDDGSLMHHGIYFEIDTGISVRPDGIVARPMVRTEHYGKGAPSWSRAFACPRPVPAITGAFISADRGWFDELGGFNEDYLFGHYEDADLSLKSLVRGRPVYMQDLPLWHMEGKGSTKRKAHEGGSQFNRWLFTHLWGELIGRELNGPHPELAALHP